MGKGRKNLKQDLLQGYPQPGEGQLLMRVLALRGSNLIEAEDSEGRKTLCLLPAKFNKVLWVKRGTFVIVDEGDREKAEAAGLKVTGTISNVLYEEHRRALEKTDMWPAGFLPGPVDSQPSPGKGSEGKDSPVVFFDRPNAGGEDSDEDEDLPPLELNNNRLQPFNHYVCTDSDSETDTGDGT